jgi:hypothetical protein
MHGVYVLSQSKGHTGFFVYSSLFDVAAPDPTVIM